MRKTLYLLPILAAAAVWVTGCAQTEEENIFDYYGFTLEDENDTLWSVEAGDSTLTMDITTTQFTFTDANGQTWYSSPASVAESTGSDAKNAASNLVLEYSTEQGVTNTYNTTTYSVEKGLYQVEKVDDGTNTGFDVHYTIGNISREYILPMALPESEMDALTANMEESDIKKYIKQYYRLYDINNLRSTDDKNSLLQQYPDLANGPMYIFTKETPGYIQEKIETIFEGVGFTREDYLNNLERYGIDTNVSAAVFNATLELRIVDNTLVATVPYDSIEHSAGYYPIHLDVLPYFAAASKTDEGYMLVPDGSGAIINFNNGKTIQSPYNSKIYGWDDSLLRTAVVDDSISTYAAFGLAYNGGEGQTQEKPSSVLCIITDGQAYGTIEADIAGRLGDYNYTFASYDILHYVDMDVSAKSDKTVRVFEKTLDPDQKLSQTYVFGTSDSYLDMAVSYREYLTDTFGLTKQEDAKLPIVIEAVGAVDTIDQVMGIPTTVTLGLTSYKEAADMIAELNENGVNDISFKYSGWFNGGVNNTNARNVKLIPELGSKKDFSSFIDEAAQTDTQVYLGATFSYIYRDKWYDSYSVKADSSKYIGREIVELYPFSEIWFGENEDDKLLAYLTKPSYWSASMENYGTQINKLGATGVAPEDIGYKLNADYNPKDAVNRQDSLTMQTDAFAQLKDAGNGLILKGGNDYTLPYADVITNMWIESKLYNIEDASVPFYEIAVHGLVDYTGTALNIADDYESTLLHSIETGAGIYYTLMQAEVSELSDTEYTSYYGSDYSKWKDNIIEQYGKLDADLSKTYNQFIVGHEIVADGVTMTEYEDGTKVYVNYNYTDYSAGSLKVEARNYAVTGGDQ